MRINGQYPIVDSSIYIQNAERKDGIRPQQSIRSSSKEKIQLKLLKKMRQMVR